MKSKSSKSIVSKRKKKRFEKCAIACLEYLGLFGEIKTKAENESDYVMILIKFNDPRGC